jgi:signal transduction histidine kinase
MGRNSSYRARMRSDPPPRIGLMPVFALTGALAIGLFSAGMAWLLTGLFESRLLERDAAISRDFVQSIVNTQKVAPAFGPPGAGQAAPGFGEFFAHVAAMPDVLRANVYSAERRVLWSSRPEIIGQVFGANDELDEALAGRVVVNPEHGDNPQTEKAEHVLMDGGAEYVENYLPVRDETGQRVIGVIELYRKPVALFDAIHSGQRLVWLGAVVGGLFLFACLAWFVMRVQRALRDQQSRLVEAEALAMVGEISASVAHSIRNPLGSIRSTAELQRELGHDAPASAADDVIRHVDRIEHLVRTLLSYAREPAERGARAELRPVLADSAARFATEFAAQGKGFSTELAEGLGAVAVDPVLLAQVLASVLSNAAEATKAGDTVRLAARREGPRVVIVVEDSGSGIAAAQLGEVTRPFFTTKPRGLGLGLALVRRVAERQGGRLHVASPGAQGGTRVTLELRVLPAH